MTCHRQICIDLWKQIFNLIALYFLRFLSRNDCGIGFFLFCLAEHIQEEFRLLQLISKFQLVFHMNRYSFTNSRCILYQRKLTCNLLSEENITLMAGVTFHLNVLFSKFDCIFFCHSCGAVLNNNQKIRQH